MEVSSSAKQRVFRKKSTILSLLQEQQQSGLSIQAFCVRHSIPSGSFHNWKRRYSPDDRRIAGQSFTPLQIQPAASQQLFAEVGCIKLYQPVSAGYLKELAS
jgi:hypothetical protein